MADSNETNPNANETPTKQEWETPVLTSLDSDETAGVFPGGVEADLGMTS